MFGVHVIKSGTTKWFENIDSALKEQEYLKIHGFETYMIEANMYKYGRENENE